MKPTPSLATLLLLLAGTPASSFAALPPLTSVRQPQLISQAFRPPDRGNPSATVGGATRGGSCLEAGKQPVSLLPKEQWGLTLSERPTFFWYIPASPVQQASFLLLNDDDSQVLYETTLTLPPLGGIVSLQLPPESTTLQVGKRYHWYLTLNCNSINLEANPLIEGWVERIEADAQLAQALKQATPQTQAKLYAEAGIWYEALTTLANLRRTQPRNAQALAGWTELLRSVDLGNIVKVPLTNCCQAEPTLSFSPTNPDMPQAASIK